MRAPNFFILGAQKSGTTYLARELAEHPDVFFSDPKEPLLFSKTEVDRTHFENYLATHFSGAGDQKWVGEGSTTYLQWPIALERMQTYIQGDPRFIVCLRNPTEKAVSFFIHNWRRGRYRAGVRIGDTLSLPLTLSPLATSVYAESIARWLGAYPRESFCFIKFDLLQQDPAAFVRTATDFLGIAPPKTVARRQVNAGFRLAWKGDTLVIDDPDAPAENRPEFSRRELMDLHAGMLGDIDRTEALTGLDLSPWRAFPAFD